VLKVNDFYAHTYLTLMSIGAAILPVSTQVDFNNLCDCR